LQKTLLTLPVRELKVPDLSKVSDQPYYTLHLDFPGRKSLHCIYGLPNKTWQAVDAATTASPMGKLQAAMLKKALAAISTPLKKPANDRRGPDWPTWRNQTNPAHKP